MHNPTDDALYVRISVCVIVPVCRYSSEDIPVINCSQCMAFILLKMLSIVGMGQFTYSIYVYDERGIMLGQQRHPCGIYWLALQ